VQLLDAPISALVTHTQLTRTTSAKSFEERLKASIEQMGLAEPLKVAAEPGGQYLVIDGALRLKAIQAIHAEKPSEFATVPVYVLDYERRFEIRYQSDIYQDLLPSQLASLVEHVHQTEHVTKIDIARFIGVSPATLRNYTGLWRLLQRGGLFAGIVRLMDAEIIPASNPYAWLRLTSAGLGEVLVSFFTDGQSPEEWIDEAVDQALQGRGLRFITAFVEDATSALPADRYRGGSDLRAVKRDLGLRRAANSPNSAGVRYQQARQNVAVIAAQTGDLVMRTAAQSLVEFLQ
jgi:hypothetical protein